MGVQAMVKGLFSGFKSSNLSNPRSFSKLDRRFASVAAKVDAEGDISQQQKLEDLAQLVARQLIEVAAGSGDVSDQLRPRIYERVKGILSEADRMLDAFQPPPEGHTKGMEKAISQDEKALATLLNELGHADETTLKSAHEMGHSSPKPLPTPHSLGGSTQIRRESTLPAIQEQIAERQQSTASTSGISEVSTLWKEEKAHEQVSKTLKAYKEGKENTSILMRTSRLGSDGTEYTPLAFSMDQTFCGLADTFMEFGNNDFVPDFWSNKVDRTQNPITPSGMCFEWQDPSKKVMDVISKSGHRRIETVCKDVEYIVALVKNGEQEKGMPIDIPRAKRLPTYEHFQNLFPDHIISQICRLESRDDEFDPSTVLFDSRVFRHHTAPLLVELSAEEPRNSGAEKEGRT